MVFYIHKADNGRALISFQCQIQINTIMVAPKQFISTHTQYVEILEGKKREKREVLPTYTAHRAAGCCIPRVISVVETTWHHHLARGEDKERTAYDRCCFKYFEDMHQE